ncbi:hypothetical protein ABZX98_16800 [Streptomyces sp. NPDC002992]|uniref:hypothetical protein n=1 Tax=Streptomyces sp. NPDC002992 TaxID=3154273 RepID=UPI0033BD33F0
MPRNSHARRSLLASIVAVAGALLALPATMPTHLGEPPPGERTSAVLRRRAGRRGT